MQLTGSRRHVSCVIPCCNHRPYLTGLLPRLADALTESGYPWEVLVMDAASTDGTESALRGWCNVDGFRLATHSQRVSRSQAILGGLEAARGDASIVIDARTNHSMDLVRRAITRWTEGARIVVSDHRESHGVTTLHEPLVSDESFGPVIDTRDFAAAPANLVLIDRTVISAILSD